MGHFGSQDIDGLRAGPVRTGSGPVRTGSDPVRSGSCPTLVLLAKQKHLDIIVIYAGPVRSKALFINLYLVSKKSMVRLAGVGHEVPASASPIKVAHTQSKL